MKKYLNRMSLSTLIIILFVVDVMLGCVVHATFNLLFPDKGVYGITTLIIIFVATNVYRILQDRKHLTGPVICSIVSAGGLYIGYFTIYPMLS